MRVGAGSDREGEGGMNKKGTQGLLTLGRESKEKRSRVLLREVSVDVSTSFGKLKF